MTMLNIYINLANTADEKIIYCIRINSLLLFIRFACVEYKTKETTNRIRCINTLW